MDGLGFFILSICAFGIAANVEACRDVQKQSVCTQWKNAGYCTDDRYKKLMKINCRLTCGQCGVCSDVQPQAACIQWKKQGLCTMDQYKDWMKRNCELTCGHCGECTDDHASCTYWQQKGLCSCMRQYCRRSCQVCSDATTRPQPVTTNPQPVTPVPGSCGKPEVQQSRVISGIDAAKGSWPWQILMLFNGRTMCGGSIVAPNWIVTAAHCVSGRERQASYFTVRAGEHITSTTSDGQHQDIQVEKIISHPSYSGRTINNDIALMKLKTPIRFDKYVKPVCLPNQGQHVPVGTQCYITGWGKIKHPGNMHHTLQQGKMPVVSKQTCATMNTKNFRIAITDQMVCAGHGGTTRVSGCHGDSGGPFVCKTGTNGAWVLHGAVSWGSGRCDATQGYTVFARVAAFKNWLDQTMANN